MNPWFLERWNPRPNNHWQRSLPQVDGQLMDQVNPPFPDPVEDVPQEIEMVCFKPSDWHDLFEAECP